MIKSKRTPKRCKMCRDFNNASKDKIKKKHFILGEKIIQKQPSTQHVLPANHRWHLITCLRYRFVKMSAARTQFRKLLIFSNLRDNKSFKNAKIFYLCSNYLVKTSITCHFLFLDQYNFSK